MSADARLILTQSVEMSQSRRRRVFLKLLATLVLLAAVKLAEQRYRDRVWNSTLELYWQERCLTYRQPADRVAYVAAPSGALFPQHLREFTAGSRAMWTGSIAAAPYPVELAELQRQIASHSPQRLTAAQFDVPWEDLPGPIFLHGRRDSQRRQRLVTLYVLANNPPGWWSLVAIARDPITRDQRDGNAHVGQRVVSTSCWPMPRTANDTLVAYAGQPDPKDESKVSIQVVLNGKSQTVTGTLRDDGKIDFTSTSGLSPWGTNRTGAIIVPMP